MHPIDDACNAPIDATAQPRVPHRRGRQDVDGSLRSGWIADIPRRPSEAGAVRTCSWAALVEAAPTSAGAGASRLVEPLLSSKLDAGGSAATILLPSVLRSVPARMRANAVRAHA